MIRFVGLKRILIFGLTIFLGLKSLSFCSDGVEGSFNHANAAAKFVGLSEDASWDCYDSVKASSEYKNLDEYERQEWDADIPSDLKKHIKSARISCASGSHGQFRNLVLESAKLTHYRKAASDIDSLISYMKEEDISDCYLSVAILNAYCPVYFDFEI